MKRYVVLAGNIGAGKSTLVRMLCSRLGWKPYYEPVAENPYLEDFYKNMPAWAFHSQVFFLTHRVRSHRALMDDPWSVVQDRSMYEDAEVFARNLYLHGRMSERDWGCYRELYRTLTTLLPAPDLVVYLRASVATLRARIRERGRGFEAGITDEYLAELNRLYEEWVGGFDLAPVLAIPADELDFVASAADFETVLARVEERLAGQQVDLFREHPVSPPPGRFYLPEDPVYPIGSSALDSARFAVEKCLVHAGPGRLAARSSFVDPEGEVMGWHEFGPLEGPGWAANAVGGAWEIHALASLVGREETWHPVALAVLDHVLEDGFIDPVSGFITPYRRTDTGAWVLNYRSDRTWLCPGSLAKVGVQLLTFADDLAPTDPRVARMRGATASLARWIQTHARAGANGWYPRRVTLEGEPWPERPDGGPDPLAWGSADGLYIVQLLTALTARGLADYRAEVRTRCEAWLALGGLFGSINHDTYDEHEDVAYAVGYRVLTAVSALLGRDDIAAFAREGCLGRLDRFKMAEDRNGCATTGLLFMEESWDTAYLWECAEAALAYFEAARAHGGETGERWQRDGLTILRAIARHHHGPHGFLTEGVDWNNHVGAEHHFDGRTCGDIRYTEPFLNNLHILEPTVYYLRHLARSESTPEGGTRWRDLEGNVILRRGSSGDRSPGA